jgi:SAM-dependent methyltransferase
MQLPLPAAEKDYLRAFVDQAFVNAAEAESYLYDSWERMQPVLAWLDRLRGPEMRRVLELGASPYRLTLLLRRHFDLDLHLSNYFGAAHADAAGVHVLQGHGERHEMRYSHFNLESMPAPYAEASMDVVLFCELLEHLLLSPDFAVSEIRRVLRKGGHVVLTTPNAARLGNLVKLARGQNIYDGYSRYGAYGRHNREYTLPEAIELLKRHAFEIVDADVRNIYPHPLRSRLVQSLRPRVWREHLFVLARAV